MFIALGQTVSKGNEDAISLRINSQQKSFLCTYFPPQKPALIIHHQSNGWFLYHVVFFEASLKPREKLVRLDV